MFVKRLRQEFQARVVHTQADVAEDSLPGTLRPMDGLTGTGKPLGQREQG